MLAIEIPALRARGADITLLVRHFLDLFARRYAHPPKTLGAHAEAALLAYPWPGNVRELAHLMERVVLLHGGPIVKGSGPAAHGRKGGDAGRGRAGRTVAVDFTAGGIVLDDVERELIEKALQASNWNRAQAADLLGLSRDTLRYRIESTSSRARRGLPSPDEGRSPPSGAGSGHHGHFTQGYAPMGIGPAVIYSAYIWRFSAP